MRQSPILRDFDPKHGVSVATLAYDYPSEYLVAEHAHGSDQLIYATCGMMEVRSGDSMWLIPPGFALWVPALTLHRIRMPSAVSMRTLYLRPGLVSRAETSCAVLAVTPFLRELILESVRIGALRWRNAEHCALRDLMALHVTRATSAPTHVRMPRDSRAVAVASRILNDPARQEPILSLCADAGVSARTLQRLFMAEVGIDVDSWRRQVRLTKAVELLVGGDSVKQAAFAVGYSQPSAFVAAFRRMFGATPRVWIDRLRKM